MGVRSFVDWLNKLVPEMIVCGYAPPGTIIDIEGDEGGGVHNGGGVALPGKTFGGTVKRRDIRASEAGSTGSHRSRVQRQEHG